MICQLIFQIACGRIGLQLGEYVPDSGQKHTADSDNRFFVTTASLDSAVAFFAFRALVRLDYSVSDLYQQGLQVHTGTGNASGLDLFGALVVARAAARP